MDVPRPLQGPIATPAYPFSLGLAGCAALAAILGAGWIVWGAFALLAILNLAFFRNPSRSGPPEGVLAPADGVVAEVVRIQDPDGFVGDAWRVAIFLSVFNVHVNRAPVAGKVRAVRRSGSKFLAAFNPKASSLNVQSRIDVEALDGSRIGVVQITGLIARRIKSYVREGDTLERGAPYGLICYGSRMEIYVPASATVPVRVGDRVRAGSTVIAEVKR
jgi:phosphatidylserine decarboxylase